MIHCVQSAAKINLTLRIIGRRKDGFHEIRSLFYALPAIESLTIEPYYGDNVNDIVTTYGETIRGKNILENVLLEARKKKAVEPLRIRLNKVIPPGSGLGGGSGNAAALISWLNMARDESEMLRGDEVGSDVPFFLNDRKWAYVGGRGECVEPVSFAMPRFSVLVVIPSWSISTAKAFAFLRSEYASSFPCTAESAEQERATIIEAFRASEGGGLLPNDFCTVLLKIHPEYNDLFAAFQESGAKWWGITGSGSAAFGLFPPLHNYFPMIQHCHEMKWIRKILYLE